MKQMHRLIVTSAVYRQSSNARKELESKDPENRLLARQSRMRLPAELIRDAALAASGLLNPEIGGASVKPPQPAGVAELALCEQREVGGEQGHGTIPPRAVRPLPADRAVPAAHELRCAGFERGVFAPPAVQLASAVAEPAERSGVLRSRAGIWRRASCRKACGNRCADRLRVRTLRWAVRPSRASATACSVITKLNARPMPPT
jgi:hypothetical protein